MQPIFGFMLFAAACIIVVAVASKRGRSGVFFFLSCAIGALILVVIIAPIGGSLAAGLGAFIAPVIGLFVALASRTGQQLAIDRGAYGDYKKCPYCAEPVRREAIKCKHCGSALTAGTTHTDAPSAARVDSDSSGPV